MEGVKNSSVLIFQPESYVINIALSHSIGK